MSAKVICITNQKGGVGKTTTAISTAHGLARKGKRVVLIDLDPQGQAAVALGMTPEPARIGCLPPVLALKNRRWSVNGYAKPAEITYPSSPAIQ